MNEEELLESDYQHAQTVWETFDIQNLCQYHDFYVSLDVLILADVFENFRDVCLDYYELDPAHFYTSPGLAWQAALKMTGVRLGLITDIDQHQMVEKGLRGGISTITLTDMQKQTTKMCQDMTRRSQPPTFSTLMQIICEHYIINETNKSFNQSVNENKSINQSINQ